MSTAEAELIQRPELGIAVLGVVPAAMEEVPLCLPDSAVAQ